jgi:hypothetical protein
MASNKTEIALDVMKEVGKDSPELLTRIESIIGELTVDLLSQDEGRHAGLRKRQDITISTTTAQYKLNSNFASPISPFIEVNSSGTFVREIDIVTDEEFYHRQANSDVYPAERYGRIEKLETGLEGRGFYLILGKIPDAVGYYKLFYYRDPTENDTELIRNSAILKSGARAKLKDVNPEYMVDLETYLRMRSGFQGDVPKVTRLVLRNSAKVQEHNRQMHRIGRGY